MKKEKTLIFNIDTTLNNFKTGRYLNTNHN